MRQRRPAIVRQRPEPRINRPMHRPADEVAVGVGGADGCFHELSAGAITDERAKLWLAIGSPEAVIEKIQAYIDVGCKRPELRFLSPDLNGQLRRCIEEVLPAFRVSETVSLGDD